MVTAQLNGTGKQIVTFFGLSTDEKPTGAWNVAKIENGSVFYEMDTSDYYFYDEEHNTWLKKS